jgi:hypothetical protein
MFIEIMYCILKGKIIKFYVQNARISIILTK